MALIRRMEESRGSRILVYITGDRTGLQTKMATDAFPFALNHLMRIGQQEKIDLFIYSTGGITMAGYALVNIMREFCEYLGVLIPFKALSTATLVALGADEVVMTRIGQLSPIDPSVASPLGPQIPVQGQPGVGQAIPVNVEDVIGYLDLARHELDLKDEDSLVRVFDRLSQDVHPLTLGQVSRIREQIGFLARTLLESHMDEKVRIDNIIDILTKGRFSHSYVIGRKEAKEVLQLNIADVSDESENDILALYGEYNEILQLSSPYQTESVLAEGDVATATFDLAIIESIDLTQVFRTTREVKRVTVEPPQVPVPTVGYLERIISQSWVEDNKI
ncbi:MAG: hypothetical protein ACE5KH_05515 [Candidatus Geothermarchaeales archaeon]